MNVAVARLPKDTGLIEAEEREIIRDLYGPLRRYAGVVGSADIEPDDLVQEAFARVLRRGLLRALDDPGAYLRRTIVNLASNERRRLGRLRRALPRMASDVTVDGVSPTDLSDLMSLAPRERAALFLSAVEGYPFREVGEMIGASEAAARKIASRARRKLRRLMEGVTDGGR